MLQAHRVHKMTSVEKHWEVYFLQNNFKWFNNQSMLIFDIE